MNREFVLPDQHCLLLGPRGTGKSTMLRQRLPDALFVDLLLDTELRKYSASPDRLVELVDAYPERRTVVVDEIQRVPELLSVVHHLIERHDGRRYILTGSSARKLKKHGVDLLAGRALRKTMHPFTARELGRDFSLERSLAQGMLPVVHDSTDPLATLDSYVSLYVREEVQLEGLTRNIGDFNRFLEAASFSHGSQLNVTNISRECQVHRKVVESYVSILEDLLLASRLRVFSRRAQRALVSHPKLFFFDSGVFRALRPKGPLDRPEEIEGAALEGLVLQHLQAFASQSIPGAEVRFWRTVAGKEVDFVVYAEDIFCGIEVKNTRTVRPKDLRGLRAFADEYPEARLLLLYRGEERLQQGNVRILPVAEFLPNIEAFIG